MTTTPDTLEALRPAVYARHRDAIEEAEEHGWTFRVSAGGEFVAEREIERDGRRSRHLLFDDELAPLLARVLRREDR